ERQQQPLDARAENRIRVVPAVLLELASCFLQPPAATATGVDDLPAVEIELRRRLMLRLLVGGF
ncbi:MAG: hypothetical protein ACXVHL_37280, partial [Solirubrobacteraceae bacterium]